MNMITLPVIALKSMTVLPDMVIHFDSVPSGARF